MKTVLLLFGGESSEHAVSMASAKNVAAVIERADYDVQYGYISPDGRWYWVDGVQEALPGDPMLLPVLGEKAFQAEEDRLQPDVIFPILHGRNGEDGSVQALAQLLHIPIVGNGMTASAVAMDKVIAKRLASSADIPVVPFVLHRIEDPTPSYQSIRAQLGDNLFVKPTTAGSSVGVTKVTAAEQFEGAITEAHKYDPVILIEKAIDARELEVAILGNYPYIEASPVGEIMPDAEFYSYDSKYAEDSTSVVKIPAEITHQESETLRGYARHLFKNINGSGLGRVDFFMDKATGQLYFNEINAIPGFTNISVYPKAWEAAGMSNSELVGKLIKLALQKEE